MVDRKLKLNRNDLAAFLQDHNQIKQFERLFGAVDDMSNDDATALSGGGAEAKAQAALDQLARIASALELLASQPPIERNTFLAGDYIDLPVVGPHVTQARRIQWNANDGTVDIGLNDEVTLQVGQETHFYAKNTSGAQIDNGTPVMFTGTVGASGKLTFGLAVADGSVPPEYMMGVATEDIPDNEFGYVTSFGLVRGFNTTGTPYGEVWADGDLLYFDSATPGDWTNVQPSAPNIAVPVAVVVNAGGGGSGSIFVRMHPSTRLNDLQDVTVATPATGELLVYNGTVWANTGVVVADLTNNTGRLIDSSVTLTNGAAAAVGTLNNAPVAGDPTKWVAIDDNGTTRYIPAW